MIFYLRLSNSALILLCCQISTFLRFISYLKIHSIYIITNNINMIYHYYNNTNNIIIINYSSLIFPIHTNSQNDNTLILNLKYEEIIKISHERIEHFFEKYERLPENELNNNINTNTNSGINSIFKKILFESNKFKDRSRVLLISNVYNEYQKDYFYDQKYLFLLKTNNIVVDCLQIGALDSVYKLQQF